MCCVGKLELIDKCVCIFKPVESDVTAVVGIFLKGRLGSPFFSSSDVHLKCQESAKGTQTFWNDVFIWFLSLSSILMKDTHCDITVYLLFCIPIYFTWANNSVSSLSFSLISLIFFFTLSISFFCPSEFYPVSFPSHLDQTLRTIFAQWRRSWTETEAGFMGQWACCCPWLHPSLVPPLRCSSQASPSSTCPSCRCCVLSMYTWHCASEPTLCTRHLTDGTS